MENISCHLQFITRQKFAILSTCVDITNLLCTVNTMQYFYSNNNSNNNSVVEIDSIINMWKIFIMAGFIIVSCVGIILLSMLHIRPLPIFSKFYHLADILIVFSMCLVLAVIMTFLRTFVLLFVTPFYNLFYFDENHMLFTILFATQVCIFCDIILRQKFFL